MLATETEVKTKGIIDDFTERKSLYAFGGNAMSKIFLFTLFNLQLKLFMIKL